MEFKNLTPFDALCFSAMDPTGAEHPVVVMKVGYRLQSSPQGWAAEVMDETPLALCLADQHRDEPGMSSVAQESDLAPYKPRCDVLVVGKTYAPNERPTQEWTCRVRLSAPPTPTPWSEPQAPQPLNPMMGLTERQRRDWEHSREQARLQHEHQLRQAPKVLLDKTLRACGPSEFKRNVLLPGWHRTAPRAASEVDLLWEHAFGGANRVHQPKAPEAPPLYDEVCFANPLGTGWIEHGWFAALRKAKQPRPRSIRAPQIEYPDEVQGAPVFLRNPPAPLDAARMAQRVQQGYGPRPAGLGPTGRAWAPRLALAGTYDDTWLAHKHPAPPDDFDFAYWNGAPADQQIGHLPLGVCIELWNLAPPAQCPSGHLSVTLPRHRAFVLMRMDSGVMLPLPMLTDTVQIDTEQMTVALTHRISLRAGLSLRSLELRFEVDPDAPLVRWEPGSEQLAQV